MYESSLDVDDRSPAMGLTPIDFYHLSEPHKQIINWIRQQGDCSLVELAVHFCQDEETIFNNLSLLVEKGFLEQTQEADGFSYHVRLAARRGRQVPDKLKNLLSKKRSTSDDRP
jgi:predicted HTH transcriptional regulator